ncbi:uncharacterized protein Dwil_GK23874 [Drosophila willistoni]|uniref:Uncharacterized protein n=1 Tax=Drosophila willistoni TaxID=7260 RepID=B4N6X3_DROWI|nr:uncharacterized protein Dwil_GK23874 [Drosophila willistoni]
MLTKTELPCIVEPVVFEKHPSFVALCLSGPDVPENLVELHNGEKFLSRLKLHNWYCENIKDVIPELDNIQCGKNAYKLEYTGHGYAVAHTLVATCIGNSKRQIYFDFVPAFEFDASAWHNGMKKARNNNNGSWFAVPRKFTKPGAADDPLSFMVCAPYWERMVLQDKQNLKDSLRLMKAMRNANGMDRLISYMIKSIFMNRVNTDDEMYNWNKSPGNILISVSKLST